MDHLHSYKNRVLGQWREVCNLMKVLSGDSMAVLKARKDSLERKIREIESEIRLLRND